MFRRIFPEPALLAVLVAAGVALPAASFAQGTGDAAGSSIADRLASFRADAEHLNSSFATEEAALAEIEQQRPQLVSDYVAAVGDVDQKLSNGTTPGNPDLVANWQQAQTDLGKLDALIGNLSAASGHLFETTALATYLQTSVQAAVALPGATDSQHEELVGLERAAAADASHLKHLIAQIGHEIETQSVALGDERRNLLVLRHAIEIGAPLGQSLGNGGASRLAALRAPGPGSEQLAALPPPSTPPVAMAGPPPSPPPVRPQIAEAPAVPAPMPPPESEPAPPPAAPEPMPLPVAATPAPAPTSVPAPQPAPVAAAPVAPQPASPAPVAVALSPPPAPPPVVPAPQTTPPPAPVPVAPVTLEPAPPAPVAVASSPPPPAPAAPPPQQVANLPPPAPPAPAAPVASDIVAGPLPHAPPLFVVGASLAIDRYESKLYDSVTKVLDRRPDADIQIVAVAPPGDTADASALQQQAHAIADALDAFGIPSGHLKLSSSTDDASKSGEVRIYAP